MKNISQCTNCCRFFVVSSMEVMFCSDKCSEEHDLFKWAEKEPGNGPGVKKRIEHHHYTIKGVFRIAH